MAAQASRGLTKVPPPTAFCGILSLYTRVVLESCPGGTHLHPQRKATFPSVGKRLLGHFNEMTDFI